MSTGYYGDWLHNEDQANSIQMCADIVALLSAAKVTDVTKLKGIPVEVTFDGNMLKEWRVLTEVL